MIERPALGNEHQDDEVARERLHPETLDQSGIAESRRTDHSVVQAYESVVPLGSEEGENPELISSLSWRHSTSEPEEFLTGPLESSEIFGDRGWDMSEMSQHSAFLSTLNLNPILASLHPTRAVSYSSPGIEDQNRNATRDHFALPSGGLYHGAQDTGPGLEE